MLDPLFDILFPQETCCICRQPGRFGSRQPWCRNCCEELDRLAKGGANCSKCGKYLEAGQTICADCLQKPPPFHIARAVGPYQDGYRIATKVLKFLGRKYLAQKMGALMAEKVRSEPEFGNIDLIIPVPISPNSFQVRGFNQTDLLAKQIGRELGVRVDYGAIARIKDTPHQTELSREEREKNLLYAFEVQHPEKIAGKNILLVDDVYTTGSTSRECTRILLEAGAAKVSIITWATGRGF
jgi:ComF family protein